MSFLEIVSQMKTILEKKNATCNDAKRLVELATTMHTNTLLFVTQNCLEDDTEKVHLILASIQWLAARALSDFGVTIISDAMQNTNLSGIC